MNMLANTQPDDGLAMAARIRKGDLTPKEALAEAIARVEKVNPQLNALAENLFERATEELGRTTPTGPFAGVPILIKDLFTPVAGAKMTNGSLLCKDVVVPFDAEIVTRIRKAGFTVFGTTPSPEFGHVVHNGIAPLRRQPEPLVDRP